MFHCPSMLVRFVHLLPGWAELLPVLLPPDSLRICSSGKSLAHILVPACISWSLLSSLVLIFTVPVRPTQPVPSSVMDQSPLVLPAVTSTWTPWIIADYFFFPVKELKHPSRLCLRSGLSPSSVKYSKPDTSVPDQKQHKLSLPEVYLSYQEMRFNGDFEHKSNI